MNDVLEIAFVCTGNRARSPLAEALFRRRALDLPVASRSCGVLDIGSIPPLPEVIVAAARLGVDVADHRSRPLRPGELKDVDLVVGFEHIHLTDAVEIGGVPEGRAFMLLELPALLHEDDSQGGASAVDRARSTISELQQRRLSSSRLGAPPLPDPFGEPPHVLAEAVRVIDAVTTLLAVRLFGKP